MSSSRASADGPQQPPLKRGKILPEKRLFQSQKRQLQHDSDDEGSSCEQSSLTSQKKRPADAAPFLTALPEDVVLRMTSFLDVKSLVRMRCINKAYRILASRNEAGWDNLCRVLWKDKIHVPPQAAALLAELDNANHNDDNNNNNNDTTTRTRTTTTGVLAATNLADTVRMTGRVGTVTSYTRNLNGDGTAVIEGAETTAQQQAANTTNNSLMHAYRFSIQDAQERQFVTRHEFCFDPESMTGTVWSFRFKESAGVDWTAVDPWHQGLPCRKIVFLPNGTVQQYIPAETTTTTSSNEESSSPSPSPSIAAAVVDQAHRLQAPPDFGNPSVHQPPPEQHQQGSQHGPAARLQDTPMGMTWRFLTRPMDLPTRPIGSYVRMTVGGRDVPTYSVRRSPTGNWGFLMESCWGLYASFELPPKQQQQQEAQPPPPVVVRRDIFLHVDEDNMIARSIRAPQHPHVAGRAVPAAAAAAQHPPQHEEDALMPPLLPLPPLGDLGDDAMFASARRQASNHNSNIHHEHGHGRRRVERVLRRTHNEHGDEDVLWVDMLASDTEDTDEHEEEHEEVEDGDPMDILRDDSSLLITNEIQWREAFLYNVGARILPEGDEATDEFDRAWGEL